MAIHAAMLWVLLIWGDDGPTVVPNIATKEACYKLKTEIEKVKYIDTFCYEVMTVVPMS
jgi:hypothetical protein